MGRITISDIPETRWMRWAACREEDPAIFFPSDSHGVVVAQAVCAHCQVRKACLDFALTTNQSHGVWGGASERQRRRLRSGLLKAV